MNFAQSFALLIWLSGLNWRRCFPMNKFSVWGLASALQLVNAPTRKSTRMYWLDCATMILEGYQIPLPPYPPIPIQDSDDLAETEMSIACADIYLWLSRRKEFSEFGEAQDIVRDGPSRMVARH